MINVSVSKDVLGETVTVKGKGLIKIGFDNHKTDFTLQKDNNNNVSFSDNTVSSPTPLTHWEWDFGDGQKSNQQNPIHQYQYTALPYSVKLITQNQFGSIDSTTKLINIYPLSAPTLVTENVCVHINAQELSIEFPYVLMGTYNVLVYDGIGKLVMKDTLYNQAAYKKTFAFSTGVYFLKISNESGIHFTGKCIVH
jgi:PKD repeat protein